MFNILRARKIKSVSQLTWMSRHNFRLREQRNINIEKSHLNKVVVNNLDVDCTKSDSLRLKLLGHYESLGVKIKSDNVLGLEFIVTASPKFFADKSRREIDKWCSEQIKFMSLEFGNNLKLGVLHMDESAPHIHFVVSTEVESIKKYKNQFGNFEKKSWSLNAKRFDPKFFEDLHDRHGVFNQAWGLSRGVKGSVKVHKPVKEFYKMIDKALSTDYSKEISKSIDNLNYGLMGKIGMVDIEEVREKFSPFINKILKENKSLKEKFKFDIYRYAKTLNKKEIELKDLELKLNKDKVLYDKSIKVAFEYSETIKKQQKEIEFLKMSFVEDEKKTDDVVYQDQPKFVSKLKI